MVEKTFLWDTTNFTSKNCGIFTVVWKNRRKRLNTVGKTLAMGIIFCPSHLKTTVKLCYFVIEKSKSHTV
jgi:hypothetical protein